MSESVEQGNLIVILKNGQRLTFGPDNKPKIETMLSYLATLCENICGEGDLSNNSRRIMRHGCICVNDTDKEGGKGAVVLVSEIAAMLYEPCQS